MWLYDDKGARGIFDRVLLVTIIVMSISIRAFALRQLPVLLGFAMEGMVVIGMTVLLVSVGSICRSARTWLWRAW